MMKSKLTKRNDQVGGANGCHEHNHDLDHRCVVWMLRGLKGCGVWLSQLRSMMTSLPLNNFSGLEGVDYAQLVHHAFFLGDLNYRLTDALSVDATIDAIAAASAAADDTAQPGGRWGALLAADELIEQVRTLPPVRMPLKIVLDYCLRKGELLLFGMWVREERRSTRVLCEQQLHRSRSCGIIGC